MKRRPVGIGALQKERQKLELFQRKGNVLAQEELAKLKMQVEDFRANLEKFATKYKKDIRKSGEFRQHFQQMCAAVGVDPLRSSNSYWAKLLGVGDFYYQLTIQINEVFLATSNQNGGIMTIEELQSKVNASRSSLDKKSKKSESDVTCDDILESVKKLSVLGGNIKVIPSSTSYIIHATPAELNSDQMEVLKIAHSSNNNVSVSQVIAATNWTELRVRKAVEELIMERMFWLDLQGLQGEPLYWLPMM